MCSQLHPSAYKLPLSSLTVHQVNCLSSKIYICQFSQMSWLATSPNIRQFHSHFPAFCLFLHFFPQGSKKHIATKCRFLFHQHPTCSYQFMYQLSIYVLVSFLCVTNLVKILRLKTHHFSLIKLWVGWGWMIQDEPSVETLVHTMDPSRLGLSLSLGSSLLQMFAIWGSKWGQGNISVESSMAKTKTLKGKWKHTNVLKGQHRNYVILIIRYR